MQGSALPTQNFQDHKLNKFGKKNTYQSRNIKRSRVLEVIISLLNLGILEHQYHKMNMSVTKDGACHRMQSIITMTIIILFLIIIIIMVLTKVTGVATPLAVIAPMGPLGRTPSNNSAHLL